MTLRSDVTLYETLTSESYMIMKLILLVNFWIMMKIVTIAIYLRLYKMRMVETTSIKSKQLWTCNSIVRQKNRR